MIFVNINLIFVLIVWLWRINGSYSHEMMGLELWRLLLWLTERTFYGIPI